MHSILFNKSVRFLLLRPPLDAASCVCLSALVCEHDPRGYRWLHLSGVCSKWVDGGQRIPLACPNIEMHPDPRFAIGHRSRSHCSHGIALASSLLCKPSTVHPRTEQVYLAHAHAASGKFTPPIHFSKHSRANQSETEGITLFQHNLPIAVLQFSKARPNQRPPLG
jgi:hypothetical protein